MDFIEFEIVLKNNSKEDYYLNNNSLVSKSDYIEYSIQSKDNSNTIKANSSKTFYVKALYKTKVENTDYQDGYYVDNNEFILPISNSQNSNPSTGVNIAFIAICIFILLISLSSLSKRSELILILTVLLIPTGVLAICKTNIMIDSTINIKKKNYNPCTFEGEMTPGASYTNGLVTYYYKVEPYITEVVTEFRPIEEDGWSMQFNWNSDLIDDYLDLEEYNGLEKEEIVKRLLEKYPFCSSINGKPLVSTNEAFRRENLDGIDFETLDTSHVTNMSGMFENATANTLDFSKLDTSNVKSMKRLFDSASIHNIIIDNNTSKLENISNIFSYLNTDSLDLSHFDTHNVEIFNAMFADCKIQSKMIDLSALDTHNATNMQSMFYNTDWISLDFSTFDTSKVTNMGSMFYHTSFESGELDLSSFDTGNVINMDKMFGLTNVNSINLESFNTSKVTNMSGMFQSINVPELDLSSFDTSNVEKMSWMFGAAEITDVNLNSFNTSKVTNMSYMFYNTVNLTTIDLSSFDMTNVTDTSHMFEYSHATTGYAKIEADANKLNRSSGKPSTLTFVPKIFG